MAERKLKRISFTVVNDLSYDQRMLRICGSLSQAGYQVVFIGRKLKDSKPLGDYPFQCVRLPFFFTHGKIFYIELQIRYFIYLVLHPQDIYCAIDLDTALPNLWASKLWRRKLAYDAHEYFTEVPEVVNRPNIKRIWKWVEKIFVPQTDLAYTVSPGLADLYDQEYQTHFGVIRNVPYKTEIQQEKNEKPLILYQGALNEGRALEYLIPAVKGLDVELWIAGEGDLSQSLRTLCKELNLDHQVTFLGKLKPDDLKNLSGKAFIGFNVLENKGLSYYYSLANKCFDYLQSGVPVLCSPFPEYIKLSEKYPAFIFAHANEVEIRSAIQEILNQPETYRKMLDACKIASQELNWETEELELIKLYDEIA